MIIIITKKSKGEWWQCGKFFEGFRKCGDVAMLVASLQNMLAMCSEWKL